MTYLDKEEQEGKSLVDIAEGAQAIQKEVQTGLQDAERVAILSGLQEDDRVVVRGQDQLEPGQKIQIRSTGVTAEQ